MLNVEMLASALGHLEPIADSCSRVAADHVGNVMVML